MAMTFVKNLVFDIVCGLLFYLFLSAPIATALEPWCASFFHTNAQTIGVFVTVLFTSIIAELFNFNGVSFKGKKG